MIGQRHSTPTVTAHDHYYDNAESIARAVTEGQRHCGASAY